MKYLNKSFSLAMSAKAENWPWPWYEGKEFFSPDIGTFVVRDGKAYAENKSVYDFPPTGGRYYRWVLTQAERRRMEARGEL